MNFKGSKDWGLVLLILSMTATTAVAAESGATLSLGSGWFIQSSCKVNESGNSISTTAFRPINWFAAKVPSTVLGNLVEDGLYKDIYYGLNLRSVPGTSYPIDQDFAKLPMPEESPFHCPWWYRTEFEAPAGFVGKEIWLNFQGINYGADVWLNSARIASRNDVAGAYRTYEFNVSKGVIPGARNVLAIEVFAPTEKDLALNWVDWNPTPPDKNMGLWKEVYLAASGPVALRNSQVLTRVDTKTLARADLTVTAELHNATNRAVSGTLQGRIGDVAFEQHLELTPHEVRTVTFAPQQFPQLTFLNPRLWWPRQMGNPDLYTMRIAFECEGLESDSQNIRFGIREITGDIDAQGHRLFRINGKPILIRGAGWAPDMLFRRDAARLEQEFKYVMDLGLNTIRLEGKLETEHFYNRADELGILVMAGWCCCSIWEQWDKWVPETMHVAMDSLRSQVLLMRNHPSLLVWLNGSDKPPTSAAETGYLQVLKSNSWPNPVISSASATPTSVTGPSGVKMTGPYNWVPPSYWLTDPGKYRGAHGFNTETCPGADIPSPQSLRKFIPPGDLWPPFDNVWSYHASLEVKPDNFHKAMWARYGAPQNLEELDARAQAMAYEGERAMFEAFSRNKYTSTGVIQWMLNNAWPGIMYHLYDYYLNPGGAYFGAKKGNEPLHVMYSYDDRSIRVVNNTYLPSARLRVKATVLDFSLTKGFEKEAVVDVAADSSVSAFTIPEMKGLSTTYFIRLELKDRRGESVSENFYWLSTKPDVIDWERDANYAPPATQYSDLTALGHLPRVTLKCTAKSRPQGAQISLQNESQTLAFLVHVSILKGNDGDDVLPILWDDNYVSILPGEQRQFSATFPASNPGQAAPVVSVDGWNVERTQQPIAQVGPH